MKLVNLLKKGVTPIKTIFVGASLFAMNSAVAAPPTIETTITPDSIGIGDHFTYSITVEQDMVQVVGFPSFETGGDDKLELVEDPAIDTLEQDGRRIKLRKRFVLTSFQEGNYNLGRTAVLYLDKNITDTLYSKDSIRFTVNTFKIDSTSREIYDLKAQRNLPFKLAEITGYLKWGLIILLLIIAVIIGIMYLLAKQGRKLSDIFKPAPLPPPHVEAISALEELNNQKLWQNNKYKDYYTGITDILRRYISRRYSISAMEMTSDEIIEAIKSMDLPSKNRMDLTSLLRDADLVKFAKATPDTEENESSYHKAYYFVEETKVVEESDETKEGEKPETSSQNNTNQ